MKVADRRVQAASPQLAGSSVEFCAQKRSWPWLILKWCDIPFRVLIPFFSAKKSFWKEVSSWRMLQDLVEANVKKQRKKKSYSVISSLLISNPVWHPGAGGSARSLVAPREGRTLLPQPWGVPAAPRSFPPHDKVPALCSFTQCCQNPSSWQHHPLLSLPQKQKLSVPTF